MKKKISLFNAWENREEILNRCVRKRACKPELSRLLRAKTEAAFRDVLLDNLNWVIEHDILDWGVISVFGWSPIQRIKYQGKIIRVYSIWLRESYKGYNVWWMDEYGYLVIPYSLTQDNTNYLRPFSPHRFYKYKY